MNTALIVFIILLILILRPLLRIAWPVAKAIYRFRKAMKQQQPPAPAPASYGQKAGPATKPAPSRHDYIEFEEIK